MSVSKPLGERFWGRFVWYPDNEDDCWLWPGGLNYAGYGETSAFGSRHYKAHRLAYELEVGPIPTGLCVLHRCDVRACCNPRHLFLGTRTDNARDRDQKERVARGENQGSAKLTEDDVREIRFAAELGTLHEELASAFGISRSAVSLIVRRERWGHVA